MAQAAENPFENVHELPTRDDVLKDEVDLPGDEEADEPASDPQTDDSVDETGESEAEEKAKPGNKEPAQPESSDFPSIEPDWPHDIIEYAGHKLGVRIPTQQALTGFQMSTGAYVPPEIQFNMTSMFVHRHFSPVSYAFLMMRLISPDDTEFTEESFGDIVKDIVERAGKKLLAEAEVKAKAEKATSRRPRRR